MAQSCFSPVVADHRKEDSDVAGSGFGIFGLDDGIVFVCLWYGIAPEIVFEERICTLYALLKGFR